VRAGAPAAPPDPVPCPCAQGPMSVLFFLIPLGLLFVGGALGAFHWAARDGQFDDLHTPSIRVLLDDET